MLLTELGEKKKLLMEIRKIIGVIGLPLGASISHAQLHFQGTQGSISNGLAGTGATLDGIDAIFNNQAGLTSIDSFSFIVASEARFLADDLLNIGVGVAIPFGSSGVFGLSAINQGLGDFREQKIGLSYARSLLSNFQMGVQFDLLNVSILNFGNRTTGTFELGFITEIGTKFSLGAHIFSPVLISITEEDNDVNSRLRVGGSYAPSEKVKVHLELDKWFQNPLSVRGGFEYQATPDIGIRLGMSTQPVLYSVGISYNIFKSFSIDGAYGTHPILGGTPSMTLKSDK